MEGDFIKINKRLLPLSYIYGFGIWIRNLLFDTGVLKSRTFDLPVISIGNITVGGSGKTPHVEYLIRLLHDKKKVAVLSRGYKRKTRGYITANANTTMPQIGDEPFQMHRKFKDIIVAVDANRCHGIDMLTTQQETKATEVVLLDDAYQHRYIKPGMNILLIDYHRQIIHDKLLPAGRLREPQEGKNRADIVIITKCPADLKPMEFRVLQRQLNLQPWQKLFFTKIAHDPLQPAFKETPRLSQEATLPNVLLLTGIASPEQMIRDMEGHCESILPMQFPDHHQFTKSDAEAINMQYKMMKKPAIIVTTEKDATRLELLDTLSPAVRKAMYIQPIRIEFMLDEGDKFNETIIDYVQRNTRNSTVAQSKDAYAAAGGNNTGNRTGSISF